MRVGVSDGRGSLRSPAGQLATDVSHCGDGHRRGEAQRGDRIALFDEGFLAGRGIGGSGGEKQCGRRERGGEAGISRGAHGGSLKCLCYATYVV